MRAAFFAGPRSIEVTDRPDPVIVSPTDAVVRVVLSCVCGSDLWYYRGLSPHTLGPIGHEFIGVVEQVGTDVHGIASGDLVIAPFTYCDGTCVHCRAGWTSNCVNGGSFGNHGMDGGQGERVRVPFADATLVAGPRPRHSRQTPPPPPPPAGGLWPGGPPPGGGDRAPGRTGAGRGGGRG